MSFVNEQSINPLLFIMAMKTQQIFKLEQDYSYSNPVEEIAISAKSELSRKVFCFSCHNDAMLLSDFFYRTENDDCECNGSCPCHLKDYEISHNVYHHNCQCYGSCSCHLEDEEKEIFVLDFKNDAYPNCHWLYYKSIEKEFAIIVFLCDQCKDKYVEQRKQYSPPLTLGNQHIQMHTYLDYKY